MRHCTKEGLYKQVDCVKGLAHLPVGQYPINVIDFCSKREDYEVCFQPYKTKGLRGMLIMDPALSVIVLNSEQTHSEQNFFCTHEMMHSLFHRHEGISAFQCFDRVRPQQDSYMEWQANEGAAQFLVPYQDFIPTFSGLLDFYGSLPDVYIPYMLAERYGVTMRVIEIRLNSLSYEIDQYRSGVPIEKVTLLSRKQQRNRGIIPTDYAAACDFGIPWDAMIG